MSNHRILSLAHLKSLIEEHKRQGAVVVFANGCFDLLHVGHIRYLKSAKARGDLLVVGINDDASVRRLKGGIRPIFPVQERAEIVAALECVDYVVVFSESTVESCLKTLQPQIHAKGTDYTPNTVPERAVVSSYGGRIAIVGDAKTHSVRDILRDIVARWRQVENS